MFRRGFLLIALLAGAVGVPYFLFSDNFKGSLKQKWSAWTKGEQKKTSQVKLEFDRPQDSGQKKETGDAGEYLLHGQQAASHDELREVLRFDINPRWVTQRWPRVTTTLAEVDLEGMRVPLVTGTAVDDVTGSLTYYFNKDHQVQRITLTGHTGDERKLATLLTKHFGFRQQPTLSAGLYLQRWNRHATGLMHVAHAPVVRAGSPHTRFRFTLEINRPGGKFYRLSASSQKLLDQNKQARRW